MKKSGLLLTVALFAGTSAWATGFALYEGSASATALGGTMLGRAVDASANSINPATLTDITNITVQIGFVTEHPRARIKVNDHESKPLDPGMFVLPHVNLAFPLPADFVFGLGFGAEYGLGTHFTHDCETAWSSRETTIQGFVINPNLAYKITDRWSIGAGLRIIYFDFEQYSDPNIYGNVPGVGLMNVGSAESHLKGNNGFSDVGFQIGTKYDILDNLSVGLVYKSKIDVHVKGHQNLIPKNNPYGAIPMISGPADANLDLPQSLAIGANWDITDKWHLGSVVSWTEWSSIDQLRFNLPSGIKNIDLHWRDTYRVSIAPSWDFADDWTAMLSYTYDMNCCPNDQTSTMLPPGDRQILGSGLTWRYNENVEFTLCYALVVMGCKEMYVYDGDGTKYKLGCHRGLSHAAGFSVTYRF